jgi:hypothetical protein
MKDNQFSRSFYKVAPSSPKCQRKGEKVKEDCFVQKCKFSFARSATSFICAELMRDDVPALLEMMLCLQHK